MRNRTGLTRLRFIDFYLDCVMNKDNVALLFHIASRIKCFRETGSAKMTGPEIEELIKENKLDDIPCAVSDPPLSHSIFRFGDVLESTYRLSLGNEAALLTSLRTCTNLARSPSRSSAIKLNSINGPFTIIPEKLDSRVISSTISQMLEQSLR